MRKLTGSRYQTIISNAESRRFILPEWPYWLLLAEGKLRTIQKCMKSLYLRATEEANGL